MTHYRVDTPNQVNYFSGDFASAEDAVDAMIDAAGWDWPEGSYVSSIPGIQCGDPDGWPCVAEVFETGKYDTTVQLAFVAPVE